MAIEYYLHPENRNVHVLGLSGEIHQGREGSLENLAMTVEKIRGTDPRLITNLIIYQSDPNINIDSGGLGQIISLFTTLTERKPHVSVKFAGICGKLGKLLEVYKMNTIIDTYKTLEEAIASYADSS